MAEAAAAAIKADDQAAAGAAASGGGVSKASETPSSYTFGGKTYGSVDELGKAYESANTELGKWTQQFGDLKKQYDDASKHVQKAQQWDEWWKNVQPLWGDDVEDFLRKKMGGATGKAATAAATASATEQGWDGWELMRPQEQAQRLQQQVADSLQQQFGGYLQQLVGNINDTFQKKEHWYQTYLNNHLGLLRKAIEQKLRDPNFDIDRTMELAAQAIGGQIDPIKLGQQLISAEGYQAQLEGAKKTAYEQGKKDAAQEAANKQKETAVPILSAAVPKFKVNTSQNGSPRRGLASMREQAAETIVKTFGPQWFNT